MSEEPATEASVARANLPRDARAALYALFAELLTRELDAARLEALRPFADALTAAEPELGDWIRRAGEPELAELRSEFARLFVLPGGVPPQASAWLENAEEPLAGQIATLVHCAMSALELEQTGSVGHLSLDHLGLIFAVASAGLATDVPERAQLGERVEREALGAWVTNFADALTRQSQAPIYRAAGRIIIDTLRRSVAFVHES
jgi:TorA maturation chaperone TorD